MYIRKRETEYVKRIDRTFDLVLLLLSVVAAALFEYSTYLASIDVLPEPWVALFFRMLFLPLLFTASLWFLNRVFLDGYSLLKMWLRIIIWTLGIQAFRIDLLGFVVLGFLPGTLSGPDGWFSAASLTTIALFTWILIGVVWKYTKAMGHIAFFKTKSWFLQASIASGIGLFLTLFFYIPICFLGLRPFFVFPFLLYASMAVLGCSAVTYFTLTMVINSSKPEAG